MTSMGHVFMRVRPFSGDVLQWDVSIVTDIEAGDIASATTFARAERLHLSGHQQGDLG